MNHIERIYEGTSTEIDKSNRYVRAFADGLSIGLSAFSITCQDSYEAIRKRLEPEEEDTHRSAAAAFGIDPVEAGLRTRSPDPDFPEFASEKGEDYTEMGREELDELWEEYYQRSTSKEFSSFVNKREAYINARPTADEDRYDLEEPWKNPEYWAENTSIFVGGLTGISIGTLSLGTLWIAVAVLDASNHILKSRERAYSTSKA